MKNGRAPATREYLRQMLDLAEGKHTPVIFIVVNDGTKYCRSNFEAENILCTKDNWSEINMAIISLMELVIMTFSWWGAYLSDAKDV